jgi:hypothetical protein
VKKEFINDFIAASEKDSIAHKTTLHYLLWKDPVAHWMESPREGVAHNVIVPNEVNQWK